MNPKMYATGEEPLTDSLDGLPAELRKAVFCLSCGMPSAKHTPALHQPNSVLPVGLAAKEQERIREAMKGLIIDVLKKYAPEFTEDGDAKKAMKIIKVELKKVEEALK